jgi:hypothetical protein
MHRIKTDTFYIIKVNILIIKKAIFLLQYKLQI